jgi:PPOX class probable F420-dependent enzyme
MPDLLSQFAAAKYLSLESFRKTGAGVRTPVWFAQEGHTLYLYSAPDAGKVKRIRNNPRVRIAPCSIRGEVRGDWIDASARLCAGDEVGKAQSLLRRKYVLKAIGDFFGRLMGRKHAVIAISPSSGQNG